jgi:hypothetical protein
VSVIVASSGDSHDAIAEIVFVAAVRISTGSGEGGASMAVTGSVRAGASADEAAG